MKLTTKTILFCSAMLVLQACAPKEVGHEPEPGAPADAIGVAGKKVRNINKACFYKSRPVLPSSDEDAEFQYVVIDLDADGNIRRLQADTNQAGPIQAAQDAHNNANWRGLVARLQGQPNLPALPVTIPPTVPSPLQGQGPVNNPNFQNNPSQLDVALYYNTKLTFILNEKNWSFDEKNPLDVYSGSKSNLPPFYPNSVSIEGNGKVLNVAYYSDPDTINKRDCIYDYALNVNVTGQGAGRNLSTRLVIDPGGGNKGNP